MTWIAVTVEPGKARVVRKRLRRSGVNAYLPSIVLRKTVIRANAARKRRRVVPLMAYVFIKEPEQFCVRHLMLHHVLSTKGVTGYVGIKGLGPSIIPDSDMEVLRAAVARIVLEAAERRHKMTLRKGMRARIVGGSLAGKTGSVTWVNRHRIGLEAMLFGSMRRVVVKRDDVEAA